MKINKIIISSIICASLFSSCAPTPKTKEVKVLQDTAGWDIDTIGNGYIKYSYVGYYAPQSALQSVSVIEFDIKQKGNSMNFVFVEQGDSLSSVAEQNGAFAGVNGTYEPDGSYFKANNKFYIENELAEGDLRFWKHEGALFFDDKTGEMSIKYATDSEYRASKVPNIISGSPILIDSFRPVGETFVGDLENVVLDSLEYEDYRRHQGVRHPRTALALTKEGRLLLITVDGRQKDKGAAGMSAKELTQFIAKYFAPKSALNIDGGGSTTMWMKGSNADGSGVVNFPSDNRKFDHYGQRKVTSFVLLNKE